MDLRERASRVTMLVMDCDGVLTDGRLYFSAAGEELKVFDVRDGFGLSLWHRAGYRSAIISGRRSPIVEDRASQLGIQHVIQGRDDKLTALGELMRDVDVEPQAIAYIGDDTLDVPVLEHVGFAAAVADAHRDAIRAAHFVTQAKGGRGALRELIDHLLDAR